MTLNIYSHVVPGPQEAAAARFYEFVAPKGDEEVEREVD